MTFIESIIDLGKSSQEKINLWPKWKREYFKNLNRQTREDQAFYILKIYLEGLPNKEINDKTFN